MISPQGAAGEPSRLRRRIFIALLGIATWAAVEALTFLLLSLTDRSLALPSRLRSERRSALAQATAPDAAGTGPKAEIPAWEQSLVLHPYLGFVEDPGLPHSSSFSAEGFSLVRGQGSQPSAASFRVGIFGGSVAQHLCIGAGKLLARELSTLPQSAGRPIWIDCYALGGYKQPQQLIALGYAMARGERFDLVLNLDGFNDVALPLAENLRNRVNPYYPRDWQVLAATALDRGLLRRAGEVSVLEGRRARAAGLLERTPLGYSLLSHLVWRAYDRHLQLQISALEGSVEALPRRSFQHSGPPYTRRPREAVLQDLTSLWARSSRLMDGLCRSRGVPYFHFLQPNQYVNGSKPMGAAERAVAIQPDSLYGRAASGGYPALIAEGRRLRSEGEAFFDLTPLFARVREPLYIDDCCHLSPDGTARLAREIAARIRSAFPAKPPSA